ncbi:hypothetical protein LJC48_01930 [Desulfovibrio sp. OttesenSCG-928-C06]|nr:hypothetical protein [Desulfovibrio sp. OttesenSCG-928-C06]
MKNIKRSIFLVFAVFLLSAPALPCFAQSSQAARLDLTGSGISASQQAEIEADLRVPGYDLPTVPGPDSAICYRGESGFVISPPEGWVNLSEQAAKMGLCVLYAPAGYNFDNAPAVIYPTVIAAPKGADPVAVQAEKVFRQHMKRPEGRQIWLENPGVFFSASGLEYALRYFRNGPSPNDFEMVAYHVEDGSMLMVVLSSVKNKEIQKALPGYMKMLYGTFAIKVTDEVRRQASR